MTVPLSVFAYVSPRHGVAPTSSAPPVSTGLLGWDHVQTGYVDRPLTLDMSVSFDPAEDGQIDGYEVTPSVPYTVSGTNIVITPDGSTPTVASEYTVKAKNGTAVSTGGVKFVMKVSPTPAALTALATVDWEIEVGRHMYEGWWRYHSGGCAPYSYEVVSQPAWMETQGPLTLFSAPAAPTSGTVTIRVTDSAGASITLSSDVTVIATRSRTATYTLQAGDASIAAAITAQTLGSGDVLKIPAALGPVDWGDFTDLVQIPQGSPPLIIVGEDGAEINGKITMPGCSGVILENCTVNDSGVTAGAIIYLDGGSRIWIYDCDIVGTQVSITPDSSWQYQNRLFSYNFHGIFTTQDNTGDGDHNVVEGCFIDKVFRALRVGGLAVGNTIGRLREDVNRVAGVNEAIVVNNTGITAAQPNRKLSEHPDFAQSFAQTKPIPKGIWIEGNSFNANGETYQGGGADADTWESGPKDVTEMYPFLYIHNNLWACNSFNGFFFERILDGEISNNTIINHSSPAVSSNGLNYLAPAHVVIRDNILGRIFSETNQLTPWGHLLTQENNVFLDVAGASFSYSDVFVDYANDDFTLKPTFVAAKPGVGASIQMPDETAAAPELITAPSISGSPFAPTTLTGSDGAWTGSPTSYLRQWYSNNAIIPGETGQTLSADASYVGKVIKFGVRAINAQGTSAEALSPGLTIQAVGDYTLPLNSGTSISHRGVTFHFYSNSARTTPATIRWINSALGEPILISAAAQMPSTVYMDVDPPSAVVGSWRAYGMEINRVGGNPTTQGLDEALAHFKQGQAIQAWDASKNVDPGYTGNLIQINPGDAKTFTKHIRDLTVDTFNNWRITKKLVHLTVMASLPPRNGTWFRPGVSAPTKTWPNKTVEELDLSGGSSSILRNFAKPSGWGSIWFLAHDGDAVDYYNEYIAADCLSLPVWERTGDAGGGRRSQITVEPYGSDGGYSQANGTARARALCSLYLDTAGDSVKQAGREGLAKLFIQQGIDVDGSHLAGHLHSVGAGQHWSYMPFFYLASFAMRDAAMLARCQVHLSNMTDQFWWIDDQWIGYPVTWDRGSDGGGNKRVGETYEVEHLDCPEWVHTSSRAFDPTATDQFDPAIPEGDGGLGNMGSGEYQVYRPMTFDVHPLEMMACCLLRNGPSGETGDEAVMWGGAFNTANFRAATVAYLDKSMDNNPHLESGTRSHSGYVQNAYAAWRGSFGFPRWTGPAGIASTYNLTNFYAGTSGQIEWRLDDYDYSSQTVTAREARVSLDGVQWVNTAALGTASSYTFTGLRPGTKHFCAWRQQNADGWSSWSPHWWHALPSGAANAAWKVHRNQTTSGGAAPASGSPTNTVAPAICYKPYPEHEMPRFKPVSNLATDAVDGPNTVSINKLYAGVGYWTGGTGAPTFNYDDDYNLLSVSGWTVGYQWQRNGLNITNATKQSYDISGEASGASIRCRVTVNGVTVTSNSVTIP